jgi:2-oxoisovalerate dehydrogenase E1 component
MIPASDSQSLYRALLLPRLVEDKMLRLLRQGKLSKWFSGIGQEAIAVGVAAALHDDDWILPLHRNLGVFTTRGVDLERLFRQLLFKEGGFTGGRDRTFRPPDHHIVGMISHPARAAGGRRPAHWPRSCGTSGRGGRRRRHQRERLSRAVSLAAVWKLPVFLVVENNLYGLSAPVREQFAAEDLADRGPGYGIPGVICDGNDLIAVHRATSEAAARARRGDGPTLIEFKTFRMRGHEEASGTAYVPPALFDQWRAVDPVARFERSLEESGAMSAGTRDALRRQIVDEIEAIADRDRRAGAAVVGGPSWPMSMRGRRSSRASRPLPRRVGTGVRYVDAITELHLVMPRFARRGLGQDADATASSR